MILASDTVATGDVDFDAPEIAFRDGVAPLDATGDYATVSGEAALWQAITVCLATRPGEWKLRPDFGVGANDFVKKPATQSNRDELRRRVVDQLSRMRRIEKVESVNVNRITVNGKVIDRVEIVARAFGRPIVFRPFDVREAA